MERTEAQAPSHKALVPRLEMSVFLQTWASCGSSCPSSSSTSLLPAVTASLEDPGLLLSTMCICMEVPTFRWGQTVSNLLWASSFSWVTWKVEEASPRLCYRQGKVWVFLPDMSLMHTWPLPERKISQILFFFPILGPGVNFPAYYHAYTVPTGQFNTRDIFVLITMGNMHEIMAVLLLSITASWNVIPEKNFFSSCCQK